MAKPTKAVVSLARCARYQAETVRESLTDLLKPWGGIGGFVRPGMRVLLKPNLLTAAAPDEAVTTHPLLLRVLAELVREAGGKVYIGDSSAGASPERVLRVSGVERVLRETGAELLPFDQIRLTRFQGKKDRLLPMAGALQGVDLMINVAKLKTHTLTGLTGAVKNTYGCVVGKHKMRLHFEYPRPMDFAHLLVDIYLAVNPALSIIDAVVAMEGIGPRSGRPRKTGLLMAAVNGIALDRVAAAITGFLPGQVTTATAARLRKLPGADLAEIRVSGVSLAEAAIGDFDRGAADAGYLGRAWAYAVARSRLAARFSGSRVGARLQRRPPFPRVAPDKCTGCAECRVHCPPQVIRIQEKRALIDRSRCIRCYCCQEMCPHGAIGLFPG